MVNITHKSHTLRKAIAQAVVSVSRPETIRAIEERKVPKGDVLEAARVAGLFAAKRTHDIIPDCHPLPVEFTAVTYQIGGLEIHIRVEVHTVYKTGVEVEAMHAASVVALTMYDMLKPIDPEIVIGQIKLLEKSGGKTDRRWTGGRSLRAAVVVCSDSVAAGTHTDRSGAALAEKLATYQTENLPIELMPVAVVADEVEQIRQQVRELCRQGVDLLLLTGGTGLSPRDVTPEALAPLIERPIPGVEEAMRAYGQLRTPYAMLSRSVAGLIAQTLVLALPGSVKGATECMDAVFPAVLHTFKVMESFRHD